MRAIIYVRVGFRLLHRHRQIMAQQRARAKRATLACATLASHIADVVVARIVGCSPEVYSAMVRMWGMVKFARRLYNKVVLPRRKEARKWWGGASPRPAVFCCGLHI